MFCTNLPLLARGERRNATAQTSKARSRDALMRPSSAHHHGRHFKNRFAPGSKRGSKAPKGACLPFRANPQAPRPVGTGAAARSFGARSPSGALLRHSPGRTHPPLAQLQFPRFLRPNLTGITRFGLSRVYRAPRRPVVVPVERWPRAARERMANPPAGTAPAPLFRLALPEKAPSMSEVVSV